MKNSTLKQAATEARKAIQLLGSVLTKIESALDEPPTSGPPLAKAVPVGSLKGADLDAAVRDALKANGKRPPPHQIRRVSDHDRAVVMEVRRRTTDKEWPQSSKWLQANLKLTRQQVAGIVATSSRRNGA